MMKEQIQTTYKTNENGIKRKFVILKCRKCGKDSLLRIEIFMKNPDYKKICKDCWNNNFEYDVNNRDDWKGTRYNFQGYNMISLPRTHRFYNMTNDGRVLEHRLVMALVLNRPLKDTEIIHHIDGNKQNNNPSNLMLVNSIEHSLITRLETKINELEEENNDLKRTLSEYADSR